MISEELIIKFQNKNVNAFNKLYSYYSGSLLGVIFNIVRDKELSKDILQEVFVKIWNNADKYNIKKGRFFTWILNIARNTAIDYVRSKAYKEKNKNLDLQNFVDIIGGNDNFEKQTDAIGIKQFVKQLKEKCKDIIELLFFKGYTQKEASEELKIPLGTVKTRNRNCINALRKLIN